MISNYSRIFLVGIFIFSLVITANAGDSAGNFLIARKMMNYGDYNGAIEEFKNIIKTTVDAKWKAPSYFYISKCYIEIKQPEKAEIYLGKIIKSYPSYHLVPNAKSILSRLKEDKKKSESIINPEDNLKEAVLTKLDKLKSKHQTKYPVETNDMVGDKMREIFKSRKRKMDSENVMRQKKTMIVDRDSVKLKNRNNTNTSITEEEEARLKNKEEYRMAREVESHISMGNFNFKKEKYDDALNEYRAAIEIEPGNTTALFNMGIVYMKKGNFNKANDLFEKVYRANPDDVATLLFLAASYQSLDKLVIAKLYWKRVLQKSPDNNIARTNLEILRKIEMNAR